MASERQTIGAAIILAVVLLFGTTHFSRAEMFLCRDRSGAVNFTNVRNSPDCKEVVLQKESGSWANVSIPRSDSLSTRFDQEILRIATRYNVDPPLIKAIIYTESNFDDQALSPKGAQGLMQLMPATARDLQVANPFDPRDNIDGGTRYIRQLLDIFHEDLALSLAAYNAGPGLVSRIGGVPEFPETVQYVKKVLKQYKKYKETWSKSSSGFLVSVQE